MVVLWWQSRHMTSSSPGSAIRSARVGGPVMTGSSSDAPQILPSCSHQPVNRAIDPCPLHVSTEARRVWHDTLPRHTGNDQLTRSAGKDRIIGDLGDDWIVGGDGNDRLTGDTGDPNDLNVGFDDFVFDRHDGTGTITDFQTQCPVCRLLPGTPVDEIVLLGATEADIDAVVAGVTADCKENTILHTARPSSS